MFEILVCKGPECAGKGDADAIHARLLALITAGRLQDEVNLDRKNCFGRCTRGPNVYIRALRPCERRTAPEAQDTARDTTPRPRRSVLYSHVTVADTHAIVEQHIRQGQVLEHLVDTGPAAEPAADQAGAHASDHLRVHGEDPRLATRILPSTTESGPHDKGPTSSENG